MSKYVLIMTVAILLALPGVTIADPTIDAVADPVTLSQILIDAEGDLQYNPWIHSSITFQAVINITLDFWGSIYAVTIDKNGSGLKSGDADWIYDLNDFHMIGEVHPIDEYMLGVGQFPNVAGGGDGRGKSVAYVSNITPEQYFTYTETYTGGGILAKHEILPGAVAIGDHYDIILWTDAYNKGAGVSGPFNQGYPVSWTGGIALGIDIVPEPASAVLLALGGLAVMRRRKPQV